MRRASVSLVGVVAVVLISLALAGRQERGDAQDASPAVGAPDCPTTTPEENKGLARGYFEEVYNGRDPERVEAYLADGFVRNNPGRPQENEAGNADDIARVADNLADFPDLRLTVEDLVAEGDKVVARVTWTGSQAGPIEAWGSPGTGRPTSYWLTAIYRVACGQLAEQWVVVDYFSMVRQVGIVTDDELATVGTPTVATPAP